MIIEYRIYTEPLSFEFWGNAGWFFASRLVEKELGAKMHADKNMVWVLAFDYSQCVGISGIKMCNRYAELKHSYVISAYRGNGIYTAFSKMRINLAHERGYHKIKVTCTDMSKGIIASLGFTEKGKRGRYTVFELDI